MPLLDGTEMGETLDEVDQLDVAVTDVASSLGRSHQARLEPRRSSISKVVTSTKSKKKQHLHKLVKVVTSEGITTTATSLPKSMLASRPLPLLVCSVGNPGSQFANTLHSAGHTVLNRLADRLGYPGFHKDRQHGNGLISKPSIIPGGSGDWTLWQSTAYMNDSGKGVRAAYMAWAKNIVDGEGRLVIVHDELEKPLGAVTLKTGQGLSAKGHNGLKSIMSVMGNTPFVRIGIGIGRPVSRESNDVARYVLKKMDAGEKSAVEGSIDQVIAKLKQLETG
ncbi:uncharacterized protein RCC_07176 [Ramularia collo-cygni]|uniref:peptidyl-tRNA hydrolase n=1 Tax=Ramularia collo-cygni TaxID=112498 RepID=A0A2D3VK10_9PEZI|nr:uncharacterized protein RCC_07176 [Ramularia collo-cygni]CZT21313.1 uncharacterized protein RCC_07176 [Ramularia collo-cygni]